MKRLVLHLAAALLTFLAGTALVRLWHRAPSKPKPAAIVQSVLEKEAEWRLTSQLVSSSLQTHSFRSTNLRRNSNDEIVWRWLKAEIAAYPQNWVRLEIKDTESYSVILNPPSVLPATELTYYNQQLKQKGLPLLQQGKRYLPIDVYHADIICPSWSGIIDLDGPKLVFFIGSSA